MKNNFWRKTAAILCAAVFLFAFAACGDEKASAVRNMSDSFAVKTAQNGMMDGDMTEEAVPAESGQTEKSEKPQYEGNRKIIRNAALELETEKYAETIKAVEKATAELGGYIQDSRETKYDDFAYTSMTVRIPTDKLDEFLSKMDGVATVTSKSITSDDITSSYIDTESHLAALRTEQDTLLNLLSKANGISEILEIQDRLTSVRSQIEYYQSMMNTFDNELEYSTVSISIDEVKHEVATGSGYWSNMFTGLKESLYDVGTGIVNFISWFIVHIPYFIIVAVIIAVICVIIKKLKVRLKTKKAKKASKPKDENNAGQADSSDVSGQK